MIQTFAQGSQGGTWVPTFSGFSATPTVTGTASYSLIGKQCTCKIRALASPGTSNANTFTITLPFNAENDAGVQQFVIQVMDNGVSAFGKLITRAGSNIADLTPSATGGTTSWTTSGNKTCAFTITYIIA